MNFSKTVERTRNLALPALCLALAVFFLFPWLAIALRWPGRILFFAALLFGILGIASRTIRAFRDPKRILFVFVALLLACLLTYGFLEAVALISLKSNPNRNSNPFVLTKVQRDTIERLIRGEMKYTAFDPKLGWAIEKSGISEDGRYQANSMGFRANREYSSRKPEEVTRAICFGDSYTHGNNVGNEETWQHYAEEQHRGWEFLNFGVGAYGLAQSYLRYREFKEMFETDFVVIGCMTDNIRRTVNVYYPFRLNRLDATGFALATPWASLNSSGNLVFHPNPLPSLDAYQSFLAAPEKAMRRMAKQDLLFQKSAPTPLLTVASEKLANADFGFLERRLNVLLDRDGTRKNKTSRKGFPSPFDPNGEIFRINCRLFQEFSREVKASGATPLILWFPNPKDVDRFNQGGSRIYEPFIRFFEDNNLRHVDSLEWIAEAFGGEGIIPVETVFVEGHYSPAANQLIGKRLGDCLKREANR